MKHLYRDFKNDNDNADDERTPDASAAFFELANAPIIAYRLPSNNNDGKINNNNIKSTKVGSDTSFILINQDVTACGQHTGGIVWETSFLLLEYLLHHYPNNHALGRTLEVGAGCGLLGQVLGAAGRCSEMILTETAQVLVNLQANLERNQAAHDTNTDDTNTDDMNNKAGNGTTFETMPTVRACCLDWEHCERDAVAAGIAKHSCDTILGTDVLFAIRFVEPLWKTLQYLSSAANTVIYLCVQIRCAASHQLFLDLAPQYQFDVQDVSSDCFAMPSCQWGRDLECFVFCITRITTNGS